MVWRFSETGDMKVLILIAAIIVGFALGALSHRFEVVGVATQNDVCYVKIDRLTGRTWLMAGSVAINRSSPLDSLQSTPGF
jgi:hypothetical protein